jgi:tetratricopeptide (TPR) repeat protein
LKFTKPQLIFILVAIVAIATLYLTTNITRSKQKAAKTEESTNVHDNKNSETINWNTIETLELVKLNTKDSTILSKIIANKNTSDEINFWQQRNKMLQVANVWVKNTKTDTQNDSLANATGLALVAAAEQSDESTSTELATLAATYFKQAQTLQPDNTKYAINLAKTIVKSGIEPPMVGIKLLLDIVQKDSMQLEANIELAKFAMVSGQYDKAQIRIEKLEKMYKNNLDVLLLQTKLLVETNKTAEAKAMIDKCINMASSESEKEKIKKEFNIQ